MSQDTEHTYNSSSHSEADNIDDKRLIDESANHPSSAKNKDVSNADVPNDTDATENLEYEDFSEDIRAWYLSRYLKTVPSYLN